MSPQKKEVLATAKRLTPLITQHTENAHGYKLSSKEPTNPHMEQILLLLDSQTSNVEGWLPSHLKSKIKAYRHEKIRMFVASEILQYQLKVVPSWLKGLQYGEILEKMAKEKNVGKKEAPAHVIFLPTLAEFPDEIQQKIQWFSIRSKQYQGAIRFLNPTQPAISLRFYNKTGYRLDRNLDEDEVGQKIAKRLKRLMEEIESGIDLHAKELTEQEIQARKSEFDLIASIKPSDMVFCRSNYAHDLKYLYLGYGFINDGKIKHDQVQVSRKRLANLIFLDPRIQQASGRQDKKNHKYLEGYKLMWSGSLDYYYRPKTKAEKAEYHTKLASVRREKKND